jgi:hypothetical protein
MNKPQQQLKKPGNFFWHSPKPFPAGEKGVSSEFSARVSLAPIILAIPK